MNTSTQRKVSTVSHDFSPLCPFWTRLINPIPSNTLHPSRAYAHEPQRNSYLGLIFASSIIFLKSSLACIILFFFSLRSSSARVFTYWSNTYRNTSHPQQTHKWHTGVLEIREENPTSFLLSCFLSSHHRINTEEAEILESLCISIWKWSKLLHSQGAVPNTPPETWEEAPYTFQLTFSWVPCFRLPMFLKLSISLHSLEEKLLKWELA